MAKARATGPHGVDRWTSNGYGIFTGDDNKKTKAEPPKPQVKKPEKKEKKG